MDERGEPESSVVEDAVAQSKADVLSNVVRAPDGTLCCNLCAQTFKTSGNCYKHLNDVHNIQVPGYKDDDKKVVHECSICGATFKWKKNHRRHMRSTHRLEHELSEDEQEGPFLCTYCDIPFTSISNLNRHCRTKHFGMKTERSRPSSLSEPMLCPLCSQKFSNEASLQCHTRIFHKVVLVSRNSSHNRKLRRRFFQFSCKICNMKLNKRFNMNRHVLSKHGVQPSDESVAISVTYLQPDVTQTQDNYHCQDCNEDFLDERSWDFHMKDVHDLRPETCCSICGAHSFLTMKDLRTHLENVHKVTSQTEFEERQYVRLHKSTLGLRDSEIHALGKIPEWLVKRANGQLVVAVYRS